MTATGRTVLVTLVVFAAVLAVGALSSPAAAQPDLSCVDGPSGSGTYYETDSGLTVIEDTDGTTINEHYFPDANTVRFDFQSDAIEFQSTGDTQARVDVGTGTETCVGNVDAGSATVDIQPDSENDITLDGSSIDVAFRDVNYDSSNDEVDIAYDATALNELTVHDTGFSQGRQVVALNADDGSQLDSAAVDASGSVTFTGLPDDQAYDLDLESAGPFFEVTIDSIDGSVTEGDTVTVEYTIENTGDASGTQDVVVTKDGTEVDSEDALTLDFGNTFEGSTSISTSGSDTPSITVEVSTDDDSASSSVPVEEESGGGGSSADPVPVNIDPEDDEEDEEPANETDEDGPQEDAPVQRTENATLDTDDENQRTAAFSENSTVERVTVEEAVSGNVTVTEYESAPDDVADPPGQSVSVTDISVPDEASDSSGTVTKRIPRDRVDELDAAPEDLRVTHFEEGTDEWELLDTTATEQADVVVLEASTDSFSLFAVSAVSEPTASAAVTPSTVTAGEEITLDASASTTEYGNLTRYEWTVGGEELTGEQVTTTVDETGELDVSLQVTNDANLTDVVTTRVTVEQADDDGDEQTDDGQMDDGTADDSTDTEETGDGDGTGDGTGTDTTEEPSDGFGPGFGVALPLAVLLAVALVVRRTTA